MDATHNPSAADAALDPFQGVDFSHLERSLRRPRTLTDFLLNLTVTGMTLLSLVPLFSVVLMLLWRGGRKLAECLRGCLLPARAGANSEILSSALIIVALAVVASVPVSLLTAIYLAQAESRLAAAVRFCAKVLTGFPSILAGVFAYGAIVLTTGGYSAFAGAAAWSIRMLPTIILTAGLPSAWCRPA